jgi:hypothetical protein
MASANELRTFIAATERQLADLQRQLIAAENANDQVNVRRLQQLIDTLQAGLDNARSQLQIAQQEDALGTASAGQVVAEEQQARSENSTTETPQPPVSQLNFDVLNEQSDQATRNIFVGQNLTTTDNINENIQFNVSNNNQNLEYGTDGRYRPSTETQAIPPPSVLTEDLIDFNSATLTAATPSTQAGVGARGEDNTLPNSNATQQIVNVTFNNEIVAEPNLLDQFASYSYSVSWYLLTPDQYNAMQTTQKKSVSQWKLLVQSGGIPTNNRFSSNSETPIFSLDYYLDNLEIESYLSMKGTGSATNATDIKFTVTEPNGITLLSNLYNAVLNLYRKNNVSKDVNYTQAQYCLVVRFYGYDQNGNLVKVGRTGTNNRTNLTDPSAVIEKFFPFVITNISFRIANKVVEYQVQAKPIPYVTSKSQDRGTIPYSFELSGVTVGDVLKGKTPTTTASSVASEGRQTSPSPAPGTFVEQVDTENTFSPGEFAITQTEE